MILMPGEVKGKAWKLARPFHGPYRILSLTPNNAEVVLVDRPKDSSIFVSLDRVRLYYPELEDDVSWTGPRKRKRNRRKCETVNAEQLPPELPVQQGTND